jgi:Zn-dependent protease with chaperone function
MTDVPGLTISIRVIEDDTVNAFTTLGGHIYVADGLLEALHSENSLSMVLAHEIAHAINRDPLLSTGRGLLLAMALASLSGGTVDASAAGDVASQLMLNSFDREQEQRADLMALAALHSRYGHVGGATDLFRVLSDMQDGEPAALEGLEMLSTHPDLARRIEYLQADAASRDWTELSVMPYPDRVAEKIRTP